MCLASTPNAPAPPPPPQYLHNPFLDGQTMGNGLQRGRNSLRNTLPTDADSRGTNLVFPHDPTQQGRPTRMSGAPAPSGAPAMTQPGVVMPTVGGAFAGLLAGRVTQPAVPPAAYMRAAGGMK